MAASFSVILMGKLNVASFIAVNDGIVTHIAQEFSGFHGESPELPEACSSIINLSTCGLQLSESLFKKYVMF